MKTLDLPLFEYEMRDILKFIHDPIINGNPCKENMWKKYYNGVEPLQLANKFWQVYQLIGIENTYDKVDVSLFEDIFGFKAYHKRINHSNHEIVHVPLEYNEYCFLLEILSSQGYSKRKMLFDENQMLYSRIHGFANKLNGTPDETNPHIGAINDWKERVEREEESIKMEEESK